MTGAPKRLYDRKMRSQSLITPAMFIVRALVLPMSRNTACNAMESQLLCHLQSAEAQGSLGVCTDKPLAFVPD